MPKINRFGVATIAGEGVVSEPPAAEDAVASPGDEPPRPSVKDKKAKWQAYAATLGVDTTDLAKAQIIEKVGD